MELKKEPLDVDFVVDSRPLTKKEKLAISKFIEADKAKKALKQKRNIKTKRAKKELQSSRQHELLQSATGLSTYDWFLLTLVEKLFFKK